jgi:SAM-dependent methyltransferase
MRRYTRREDWILPYVKDKNVLDLGCVHHALSETKKPGWLHGLIRKQAKSVIGVDYLPAEVDALNNEGYSMVCANVEEMKLDRKFDVIVAGEILEHVSNCGQFMARLSEHLAPDGIVLITTPNPVNLLRFLQLLVLGVVRANGEHTCWMTEVVLKQLAERYGLQVVGSYYVDDSYQYYDCWSWLPFWFVNYVFCMLFPKFSETLCVALRHVTRCEMNSSVAALLQA